MADTLYRTHPLENRRAALAGLSGGLTVLAEDPVAAVNLRIDPDGPGAAALGRTLGTALPVEPNTWTHTCEGQLIWLGPDEWLVTSSTAQPLEFEQELGWVVSAFDGAAIDVSAQRTSIRLRGPLARELLSLGCSLDLRPSAFPAGACAQTQVGHTGVLLLALGAEDFRLFVRQSFAAYLADWVLDAAEEFRDQRGEPT
ncbi:sarcosine oxidase subunit gamma [Amycolatopsis magusensis]|uniref:Sarcosine oxidase subunit gamma n=1 Tax=Amycolatopsis magusensis TaxID=882444 RepID=A0ABS4Q1Z2_9PSEU|nr:sarcosine oxidase subunit gamma family protein [Amycolatopsis magusensis]MBP2185704.1 sarcosine oxidase subunit gamma [Amycolatopsis magusensis]MDI5979724.1 sarcosine oxidase subunit gamma family protein [Amycolatopsis magusensis]